MAYSAEFREAVTQGWIQDFPKGGFRPAIRKAGGGGGGGEGVLSASGPIRIAGGGGGGGGVKLARRTNWYTESITNQITIHQILVNG